LVLKNGLVFAPGSTISSRPLPETSPLDRLLAEFLVLQ
jgi:hypothetical protein